MNYLIEHASEILKLATSLALFALFFVLISIVRTLSLANRLLKKADDLTDLFIEYIQTPLGYIIKAQKFINSIKSKFGK